MSESRIKRAIHRLRQDMESVEMLDDHVVTAVEDVHQAIDDHEDDHEELNGKLETILADFEGDHPSFTVAVNRAIYALTQSGL